MMRRQRAFAVIALIAVTAVTSACGSSAQTATGPDGGANQTVGTAQKAVKFAKCMRSHGVSQFPDPGASGKLTIDAVANGSSLDPSSPAFTQAVQACRKLEPAGFMGTKRSSAQQQAALTFAQCIRANGVKDFPDPIPNGPLVDTNRIPSSATRSGMSILNAAMRKCSDAAAAAGVTR
jgi:hypothetical protein